MIIQLTTLLSHGLEVVVQRKQIHYSDQSIHIQPENQEIVCPIKKEVNQGSRVTSRNTPRL